MITGPRDLPAVLATLRPYLADIVLIGGWVPHLYRLHGNLGWQGTTSRTTEADVLVPSTLAPNGRPKLPDLLAAGGLRPARQEPFPADWIAIDTEATAIEFIMVNPGPAGAKSPRQIEAQGWIGAIVVEDAHLLQVYTNTLTVMSSGEVLDIRVPTLGAWAVGKALTFGARQSTASGVPGPGKRAKDLLYIRDLVFAGGRVLAQTSEDITTICTNEWSHAPMKRAVQCLTAVAENGATADVNNAALELATREGTSVAAATAEIREAARELIAMIRAPRSEER